MRDVKTLAARIMLTLTVALAAWPMFAGAQDSGANLVPWPRSAKFDGGSMALSGASRIVFTDVKLAPLAKVLSDEIYMATAVRLRTSSGAPAPRDIALQMDPKLKGEQYAVSVGEQAVVSGGNYRAVAWGTVTLLQAVQTAGAKVTVARMTVEDEPVASYRGLMIDVARQWHPVESIRPLIEMCRLYKINYLQLHLNDQQSFTFPSKAFPTLATNTKGKATTYTLDEITNLVRYADERGVTIVPEMEGPGHHSGALRSLWGRKGTSCMDMGSEKTYEGMDILIGELCTIFASSPYIHIGADEASLGGVGQSDEEKAFMEKHGITSAGGLYNYYIVRMNEIIRKRGKQTICWEGFRGDGGGGVKIPKDVIVMPFESTYNPANKLVANGYSVINTAWKPLYVVGSKKWPAQYLYENWNLWLWEHHVNTKCHIQLKKTDPVLGAQMCAWEQAAAVELPSTRERIHAMSERIWNPDAGKTFADFASRAANTNKLLDRVLGFVNVEAKGLLGKQNRDFEYFWDPITVTLSGPAIGTIRYTLDGKDPTATSPKYNGPIKVSKENTHSEKLFHNSRTKKFEDQGDVVYVKARVFDGAGKPIGDSVTLAEYWCLSPDDIAKKEAGQIADQEEKAKKPKAAGKAPGKAKPKAQTNPAESKQG